MANIHDLRSQILVFFACPVRQSVRDRRSEDVIVPFRDLVIFSSLEKGGLTDISPTAGSAKAETNRFPSTQDQASGTLL